MAQPLRKTSGTLDITEETIYCLKTLEANGHTDFAQKMKELIQAIRKKSRRGLATRIKKLWPMLLALDEKANSNCTTALQICHLFIHEKVRGKKVDHAYFPTPKKTFKNKT